MPAPVIRKIRLFTTRIDHNNLALNPPSDPSANLNITKLLVDGNNAEGVTNKLSFAFDDKFSTSCRFDANAETTFQNNEFISLNDGLSGAQLIINTGKKRKLRRVRVTFKDTTNIADFRLYLANSLTEAGTQVEASDIFVDAIEPLDSFQYNLFSTVTETDEGGTTTSGLSQIEIPLTEVYGTNQYVIIKFTDPGGFSQNLTPDFIDISEISIHEEVDLRDFSVEFNDSVLSTKGWTNPRYEGCKLKAKQLNVFTNPEISAALPIETGIIGINFSIGTNITWPGDVTGFGQSSILSNRSTALYYATTVIGGAEDPQYTKIKGHSYISIQKIFNIDKSTQTISIRDKDTDGSSVPLQSSFDSYNRSVTDDFPTGGRFNIKVLDDSVPSQLNNEYFCKMNKGWLLKSFNYQFASGGYGDPLNANTLFFYSGSELTEDSIVQYSTQNNTPVPQQGIRFRYALNSLDSNNLNQGNFNLNFMGPSFASSSIIENEFTTQYYSGSFGLIVDNPFSTQISQEHQHVRSGLASASRFIGIDTLNFLDQVKDTTELHLTFFDGTKDFAPGSNDERSIGTFEVNPNQGGVKLGDVCNNFLPRAHELQLKGPRDARFEPNIETYKDNFISSYKEIVPGAEGTEFQCGSYYFINSFVAAPSIDNIANADVYVQGGVFGAQGQAGTDESATEPNTTLTADSLYSGSFNYQLSFLKKDHVIIADLDLINHLPENTGEQGIILIPEHIDLEIKQNLDFYIQQISTLLGFGGASDSAITYNQESKFQ